MDYRILFKHLCLFYWSMKINFKYIYFKHFYKGSLNVEISFHRYMTVFIFSTRSLHKSIETSIPFKINPRQKSRMTIWGFESSSLWETAFSNFRYNVKFLDKLLGKNWNLLYSIILLQQLWSLFYQIKYWDINFSKVACHIKEMTL